VSPWPCRVDRMDTAVSPPPSALAPTAGGSFAITSECSGPDRRKVFRVLVVRVGRAYASSSRAVTSPPAPDPRDVSDHLVRERTKVHCLGALAILASVVAGIATLYAVLGGWILTLRLFGHRGVIKFEIIPGVCAAFVAAPTVLSLGIMKSIAWWEQLLRERSRGRCPKCEYDLQGDRSCEVWPECGGILHR